jgi:hypothetical protein
MKSNAERFLSVFIIMATIITATIAASAQTTYQSYQGHEAAANEVLIKFQQPAANDAQGKAKVAADVQQAQVTADIDSVRTVGSAGWTLLHSASKDVTTLMSMLTGAGSVIHVEPNWAIEPTTTPNDPYFSYQWGMQNTGQFIVNTYGTPGADVDAVPAWSITTGSSE